MTGGRLNASMEPETLRSMGRTQEAGKRASARVPTAASRRAEERSGETKSRKGRKSSSTEEKVQKETANFGEGYCEGRIYQDHSEGPRKDRKVSFLPPVWRGAWSELYDPARQLWALLRGKKRSGAWHWLQDSFCTLDRMNAMRTADDFESIEDVASIVHEFLRSKSGVSNPAHGYRFINIFWLEHAGQTIFKFAPKTGPAVCRSYLIGLGPERPDCCLRSPVPVVFPEPGSPTKYHCGCRCVCLEFPEWIDDPTISSGDPLMAILVDSLMNETVQALRDASVELKA